ncbi:MAG: dynamin family protein [Bacteroidia bacterium]
MVQSLTKDLHAASAQLDEAVKDLHQLTIDIGQVDLAHTVSELRNRLHEPFMFVVVGEVKSGKSSFINALLESKRDICAVAPDPCTDTIQQIMYAEEEATTQINPFLKQIRIPVPILKDIAIVDTPGTNAIIAQHQEITEEFIPASDLIVFVFEAKNPYRQSAWEFFDYIHEDWRKKIIFVLQQADLMDAADLKINMAGVVKQAKDKGIDAPAVFAVSAKQEQAGNAESGFSQVREYIADNITGGQAPYLKLSNNVETALTISEKIHGGLNDRNAQLKADQAFRSDVKDTLTEQQNRSLNHAKLLTESLLGEYDRQTNVTYEELADGLGFFSLAKRSLLSTFSSKPSVKDWLGEIAENLEKNLRDNFDKKLRDGVVDIADSIQQMARLIELKIRQNPTILKDDHEIFGDIAERRSAVLKELQERFSGFMDRTENFVGEQVFPQDTKFSPNVAAGSGIAVIGVVLAAVTKASVFDITGGVITAVGLAFAGVTVSLKRGQILKAYQSEIGKGRERLTEEISSKLDTYITDIRQQIEDNFAAFDAMLIEEEKQVEALEVRWKEMHARLGAMVG